MKIPSTCWDGNSSFLSGWGSGCPSKRPARANSISMPKVRGSVVGVVRPVNGGVDALSWDMMNRVGKKESEDVMINP